MTARTHAPALDVCVIADNSETIESLREYLQSAGVSCCATQLLHDAALPPPTSTAVVFFPDEFAAEDVKRRIASLRASRPRLLLVVVTSLPQRLRPALDPDDHSVLPVVLSKPAFGWTILDAVREHAREEVPVC